MASRRATSMPSYNPRKDSSYRVKEDDEIRNYVRIADKIRELAESVAADNSSSSQTMEHMIDVFLQKVPLNIDDNKRYVDFDARSAKATDVIFRVMGMLMAPLQPVYIAPNKKAIEEDKVSIINQHVAGVYEWALRKYETAFDAKSLFWQLLVGHGYIQQSYAPYYWDKRILRRKKKSEKEEESDDEYNDRVDAYLGYAGPPIRIESLDPRICIPIPGPMGTRTYLKTYTVQRYELEEALSRASGKLQKLKFNTEGKVIGMEDLPSSAKDAAERLPELEQMPGAEQPENARDSGTTTSTVRYHEMIDERFIYYVADDCVVYKFDHKGGVRIFEGTGLITGMSEPHLAAVGILWAVRNELPQLDFLRTLWMNKAFMDVFPQLFAQLAGDEEPLRKEAGELETWEIEPMTVKQIRGKLVNAFQDTQSSLDFRAVVQDVAGDIDLATITSLARGMAGAQQPGYSINQLSQAMRTLWKPILESRERQWGNIFEHYLWIVKHLIRRKVTVFAEVTNDEGITQGEYLELDPDDIQDFYQIRASLDPNLPIDRMGSMQVWMKAGTDGWATDQEVSMEGFNRPDWKKRRQQIERDQIRRAAMQPAMEAALKLGNVQLELDIAQDQGLTELNPLFQQSLEGMRSTQPPGGGQEGGGAGPQVAAPTNGAGGGVSGSGIPATTGANQARPAPGPQMGMT